MSCYGCVCRYCARSVELELLYFSPGEIQGEEACFSCDECRRYTGDLSMSSQWRPDCPEQIEARKHIEARAAAMRKKLKIVR